MPVTSIVFYFVLMALFIAEGAVLSKVVPLQRRLIKEDQQGLRVMTLDGLRGVLALSVFLHHAVLYYFQAQTGAWIALPSNFYAQMGVLPVSLFFFITGYLFWTKLMRRHSIAFVPFLRDRLARLGGAYWVACLVFFLLIAASSGFHRHVSLATIVLQVVAWFSFLGAGHDMNGIAGSRFWMGQVWTLRLEWMFYLSLPFLGWFARKRSRLFLLLGLAAAVAVTVSRVTFHGAPNFIWKTVGNYAQYLAGTFSAGMLVAILPVSDRVRGWANSHAATLLSALLLGVTALVVPAKYGWLESAMLVVPFACVCLGNSWFGLLVSSPVCSLGRVSYSFYLLHGFALHVGLMLLRHFVAFDALTPIAYWAFVAVCGVVAVLASYASYQWLEHPFLRGFPNRASAAATRRGVPSAPLPQTERSFGPV